MQQGSSSYRIYWNFFYFSDSNLYQSIYCTNTVVTWKRYFSIDSANDSNLPLNNGIALNAAIGPSPVNWPRDISRKNNGIPQSTNMMTYGIKKAPVNIYGFLLAHVEYLIIWKSLIYIYAEFEIERFTCEKDGVHSVWFYQSWLIPAPSKHGIQHPYTFNHNRSRIATRTYVIQQSQCVAMSYLPWYIWWGSIRPVSSNKSLPQARRNIGSIDE